MGFESLQFDFPKRLPMAFVGKVPSVTGVRILKGVAGRSLPWWTRGRCRCWGTVPWELRGYRITLQDEEIRLFVVLLQKFVAPVGGVMVGSSPAVVSTWQKPQSGVEISNSS